MQVIWSDKILKVGERILVDVWKDDRWFLEVPVFVVRTATREEWLEECDRQGDRYNRDQSPDNFYMIHTD